MLPRAKILYNFGDIAHLPISTLGENSVALSDVFVRSGASPGLDGTEEGLFPGDDSFGLQIHVEAGAKSLELLRQRRRILPHDVHFSFDVAQSVVQSWLFRIHLYTDDRSDFGVVWFYRDLRYQFTCKNRND